MGAVRIRGFEAIKRDFREFEIGLPKFQFRYLEMIGRSAIALLKANTPVSTGDLRNSWGIANQTRTSVTIGVTPNMAGVLEIIRKGSPGFVIESPKVMRFVIGGQEIFTTRVFHPGFQANDFVSDVARALNGLVVETLDQAMAREIPMIGRARRTGAGQPKGKHRPTSNITRTVGLSKFGAGRAFGRSSLQRARTGRRQMKRRLTLRRRRGGSINSQKVQARLKGLG